jgi:transposase
LVKPVKIVKKGVMDILQQFEALLPLSYPFSVDRIEKDEAMQEVHLYLEIAKDYRPSADYTIHSYYDRSWEHLKLFQYRSFLHCRLPVFQHKKSGKTQAMEVEFSRQHSRFTLLFEQEVMRLMKIYTCFTTVAKQLKIYPQRVESIYHHYTTTAYQAHTTRVCERVGIDETSTKKGHDYITIFADMDENKVIAIEDGRGADTIEAFFEQHPNPAVIKELSMDMSPAFIKGAQQNLPWADITFDKWHVYKLFQRHIDELSRKTHGHKNPSVGAYIQLLFDYLQQFYNQKRWEEAMAQLTFIADFVEELAGKNSLSKSIRKHSEGLANYIRSGLTNGALEGINSKVQTIKRIAKGFRYTENFKKLILFSFGSIKTSLPSNFI